MYTPPDFLSFGIQVIGLGLRVGIVLSVQGCTHLSWDWFENNIHVLIYQKTGADPQKYGGVRFIGG